MHHSPSALRSHHPAVCRVIHCTNVPYPGCWSRRLLSAPWWPNRTAAWRLSAAGPRWSSSQSPLPEPPSLLPLVPPPLPQFPRQGPLRHPPLGQPGARTCSQGFGTWLSKGGQRRRWTVATSRGHSSWLSPGAALALQWCYAACQALQGLQPRLPPRPEVTQRPCGSDPAVAYPIPP